MLLMHLHLLQPLEDLQLHLISSLAASGRIIQTIFNKLRSLDHPQPSGDRIFCIDCVLVAQIPVCRTTYFTCWSSAFCINRNITRKMVPITGRASSFLVFFVCTLTERRTRSGREDNNRRINLPKVITFFTDYKYTINIYQHYIYTYVTGYGKTDHFAHYFKIELLVFKGSVDLKQ